MKLIETSLAECYLVEFDRKEDRRGSFMRSFDPDIFADLGLPDKITYTAEALNHAAFTLRGLHYQKPSIPNRNLCAVCAASSMMLSSTSARIPQPSDNGNPFVLKPMTAKLF